MWVKSSPRVAVIDEVIAYPDPPLSGATFVLRPFRVDDFGAATALGQEPATSRWVPALPAADGAGVVAFYEECRSLGGWMHLVIADRADDGYLGEVMAVLGEHGIAELGCGVVPAARGRGVATEALRVLAQWVLDSPGIGRLQVFVDPENTPALRLAERAGFRREGLLRGYWEGTDDRIDAVILSRLAGDPP